MIQDELHVKEVMITDVGAVIGSHTGPGTIAIFFLNEIPA
jgi:fatty acid-binding protein DegV